MPRWPVNYFKFQVLNISNNGVDNLDFIENLKELRILKCEDNKIEKVTNTHAVVQFWNPSSVLDGFRLIGYKL